MSRAVSSIPEPPEPREADTGPDELSDEVLGNLLDFLPELGEDEGETEDERTDLDPEVGIIEPAPNDEEPAEIDIGSASDLLLVPVEPRDDDDTDGLDEGEHDTFDSPTSEGADDTNGFDEAEDLAVELPPLDSGDDADGLREAPALPELAALGDERRPDFAKPLFQGLGAGLELEACSAIAATNGVVVAASTDLFWFGPKDFSPLRLDAGASRINSVVLVGATWEYAICSTASGKLVRRGRLASTSEELRRIRDLEANGPTRDTFDLSQPGHTFPHTLLVRSSSGRLLRSDDDGATFRISSERRIAALSPHGSPMLALSLEGTLLRSDDGGSTFTESAIASTAPLPAASLTDRPLLACYGHAVFLARPELGVLASADGGLSFRRVAGTQGVTAICAGDDRGAPLGFAALLDETQNRTWLVRISAEAASAEIIAVIDLPANDDEAADTARTAQLAWDSTDGWLWAAGGFGVKVFASRIG
jgi:hypothetical protein